MIFHMKRPAIPVFDKKGQTAGKTLLITAGVDGDEYAGIEAAYHLIEIYSKKSFVGRLIILPTVNMAGFMQGVSWNPEDRKYPKYMGVGSRFGSASQKLMYWITQTYGIHADLWLDMHGGATNEVLTPFAAQWITGKKNIDERTASILSALSAQTLVEERAKSFGSVQYLAKRGCAYILTESGYMGRRDAVSIKRHVGWTETVMGVLGMIPLKKRSTKHVPNTLHTLLTPTAPFEGIWAPTYTKAKPVKASEVLGTLTGVNGAKKEFRAEQDGVILWGQRYSTVKKYDTLLGFGF